MHTIGTLITGLATIGIIAFALERLGVIDLMNLVNHKTISILYVTTANGLLVAWIMRFCHFNVAQILGFWGVLTAGLTITIIMGGIRLGNRVLQRLHKF